MPNVSRPDLLPFALPERIGLPYHGLCTDGKVGTVDHAQPGSGDAVLVRHAKSSTPTLPNGEDENWQDYALLSGTQREIGGQELGANSWIYCDADYSWVLSYSIAKSGIEQTISVWLESSFGILPAITMTRRKLAELTYIPLSYAGANQSTSQAALARKTWSTHSATGSVSVVNVAATSKLTYPAVYHVWIKTDLPNLFDIDLAIGLYGVHNAIKIDVSGNGLITDGQVGQGITATVTMLRTAPQMIVQEDSDSAVFGKYSCAWQTSQLSNSWWTICGTNDPTEDPCTCGAVEEASDYDTLIGVSTQTWGIYFNDVGLDGTSETTTNTAHNVYRYFDVVKPSGTLDCLELENTTSTTTVKTSSASPTVRTRTESFYFDGNCGGAVSSKPSVVVNENCTISATITSDQTTTLRVAFCGAETTHIFTKHGDGTEETVSTDPVADFDTYLTCPEITESSCTENGAAFTCPSNFFVEVAKPIVNLVQVESPLSRTLLSIVGTDEAAAVDATSTNCSVNPATGVISLIDGKAICWV